MLALLCLIADEPPEDGPGYVSAFVETDEDYRRVTISDDGSAPVVAESVPKADFPSYEEFVAVESKFNPWIMFKRTPIELGSLEYAYLRALIDAFGWKPEVAA